MNAAEIPDPAGPFPVSQPAPPITFPLNYKTLFFCFFVGSVLSIPCGILIQSVWEHETPHWTTNIYMGVVLCSLFILPFWCGFALRDQPLLRWTGFVIFAVTILFRLFPSL